METPEGHAKAEQIFRDTLRSWNTDGYEGSLQDGMELWSVCLGPVHACHQQRGSLFRVRSVEDALWQAEEFQGYSPENLLQVEHELSSTTISFNGPTAASQTDVCLAAETNSIYVLDSDLACIHILDISRKSPATGRVRQLRILLPAGVFLDGRARLAVVSQDPGEPERRDPYFYISCPGSSVIVKVDADSGIATIAIGRPGRAGNTKSGVPAAKALVRRPTALHYDPASAILFWADVEVGTASALVGSQVYEVARFPAATEISSIVVYRVPDYIDSMLIESKIDRGVSFWKDYPALLLLADRKANHIFKIRLVEAERKPIPILSRTLSGSILSRFGRSINRLFILPDGDLLITTDSEYSYYLRHGIGSHVDVPNPAVT